MNWSSDVRCFKGPVWRIYWPKLETLEDSGTSGYGMQGANFKDLLSIAYVFYN